MQQFRIEILVTVNTVDTVSEAEVQESIKACLDEFDGGTAEVQVCDEV